jgi:hypothetical protein
LWLERGRRWDPFYRPTDQGGKDDNIQNVIDTLRELAMHHPLKILIPPQHYPRRETAQQLVRIDQRYPSHDRHRARYAEHQHRVFVNPAAFAGGGEGVADEEAEGEADEEGEDEVVAEDPDEEVG